MVIKSLSSSSTVIAIIDTSIKNNIATSISHTHISNRPLSRMIHHSAFVTRTEAELFAIRCDINQALSVDNISKIIVVTDSIYVARKIFDPSSHPYQIHTVAILEELHLFFSKNSANLIEFWKCPSHFN